MLKQRLQSERHLQDAFANISRKTGMSPGEIMKAFEGLAMLGYADKRKIDNMKTKLQNLDLELFH